MRCLTNFKHQFKTKMQICFFSTKLITIREYINESLQEKTNGYFTKEVTQVGLIKNKIKFNELIGCDEYQQKLQENQPEDSWLTPVEIFSPFYAQTVLTHMLKHKMSDNLNIIEIGGGKGTFLIDLLDKLQTVDQQLQSKNLNYQFVEVGQSMIDFTQNRILNSKHKNLIKNKRINFINDSFLNLKFEKSFKNLKEDNIFIIGMEVLDNFAHDRILINRNKNIVDFKKLSQISSNTIVELDINDKICPIALNSMELQKEFYLNQEYYEEQQQVQRSSIQKRLIQWYWDKFRSKHEGNQEILQIPSDMVQLVEKLKQFSKPYIIFADFDNLVSSSRPLRGSNTPIISKKLAKPDEKIDTDDFLKFKGEADIFFPVDFRFFRFLLFKMLGLKSVIRNTDEFVLTQADENWAVTKSGQRPLQEDFANTSVISNF